MDSRKVVPSCVLAYRPRPGHTDARRNLISNVHARGVGPAEAARRILALAEQMMRQRASGVSVKEELPALTPLSPEAGERGEKRLESGSAPERRRATRPR